MTFVPVPNGALAIAEFGTDNIQWTNTFWGTKSSFVYADLDAFHDCLYSALVEDIVPKMTDEWYLRQITLYDMRTDASPVYNVDFANVQGGTSGDTAPISQALILTLRTQSRGRSYRGRLYFTGFPKAIYAATDFADAATVTAVQDFGTEFIGDMELAGWTWVVCSRYSAGAPRANAVTTPITSVEVRNDTYGSQRRRTRKT